MNFIFKILQGIRLDVLNFESTSLLIKFDLLFYVCLNTSLFILTCILLIISISSSGRLTVVKQMKKNSAFTLMAKHFEASFRFLMQLKARKNCFILSNIVFLWHHFKKLAKIYEAHFYPSCQKNKYIRQIRNRRILFNSIVLNFAAKMKFYRIY